MNAPRVFIVEESDIGLRLDKFLVLKMPEFSRNEIQKFEIKRTKDEGRGTKEIKFSEKLKLGDEFEVIIPEKPSSFVLRPSSLSEFPLDILFEDDDIIVVNKSRGVAMYPGAGRETDTLVHAVLAHLSAGAKGVGGYGLSTLGGQLRPGVVHRLDKDTSGVVVLAKSDAAYRALVKTFAAHDLTRKYIAFVWGVPNWTEADIEGNIGRSTRNRQKMSMLNRGGKEAKTLAEVLNVWTSASISKMRCTLFTGRTHQIRVHLSAHGFPVVCDPLYGRGNSRLGSVKNPELFEFLKTHHGQMLYAEVLEFAHPITGEQMKFKAKLPDDMKELQDILNS